VCIGRGADEELSVLFVDPQGGGACTGSRSDLIESGAIVQLTSGWGGAIGRPSNSRFVATGIVADIVIAVRVGDVKATLQNNAFAAVIRRGASDVVTVSTSDGQRQVPLPPARAVATVPCLERPSPSESQHRTTGARYRQFAFYIGVLTADTQVDFKSISASDMVAGLPLYLAFVGLPSVFPFALARLVWVRAVVLLVMTATAATAGALIVTTDDPQAGVAVLIVAYVGVPLGVVIALGHAIGSRWPSGRLLP
jgi:hypothetical protein